MYVLYVGGVLLHTVVMQTPQLCTHKRRYTQDNTQSINIPLPCLLAGMIATMGDSAVALPISQVDRCETTHPHWVIPPDMSGCGVLLLLRFVCERVYCCGCD